MKNLRPIYQYFFIKCIVAALMLLCIFSAEMVTAKTGLSTNVIASIPILIDKTTKTKTIVQVHIPKQFWRLRASQKGYIPGMLRFLTEDYPQHLKSYESGIAEENLLPQIIRIQKIRGKKINSEQVMNKIKTKIDKGLFMPPLFVEENTQAEDYYTMHSLGIIVGYSGRSSVDVIYLQYYSGNKGLCGIQVAKTLPPTASGNPVSLENAKTQLNALKTFTQQITSIVSNEHH